MDQLIDYLARGLLPDHRGQTLKIRKHISQAGFRATVKTVEEWEPAAPELFEDLPHPSRPSERLQVTTQLTSLEYHVVKHTLDGGWPPGTTPGEYLSDIQQSALVASQLHVGVSNGAALASTHADVQLMPASAHVVQHSGCVLFTVYDPENGWFRTGYVVRSMDAARAKVAQWNKYRCLSQ